MAASAEEVGQACLEPALWEGYHQAQAESHQKPAWGHGGKVGCGHPLGFQGILLQITLKALTSPSVPWDLGCPGSSLWCHPGCKGTSQVDSLGRSTARANLPSARSCLGRSVLGFQNVTWHPRLREISPFSKPAWPTLLSMLANQCQEALRATAYIRRSQVHCLPAS